LLGPDFGALFKTLMFLRTHERAKAPKSRQKAGKSACNSADSGRKSPAMKLMEKQFPTVGWFLSVC